MRSEGGTGRKDRARPHTTDEGARHGGWSSGDWKFQRGLPSGSDTSEQPATREEAADGVAGRQSRKIQGTAEADRQTAEPTFPGPVGATRAAILGAYVRTVGKTRTVRFRDHSGRRDGESLPHPPGSTVETRPSARVPGVTVALRSWTTPGHQTPRRPYLSPRPPPQPTTTQRQRQNRTIPDQRKPS